jgi:diadenosine tetraphosphate (Ap4A) HIT family hydrolase
LIKKFLRIFSPLIGWIFTYMSFLIPVSRLRETSNLLAFHHPSPSHKFHVLIVPKRQTDSFINLDPKDTAFLTDLYSTVQSLVNEFQLKAYRLVVNGGEYQDFPHLHFHLISDVGDGHMPQSGITLPLRD